MCLAATAQEPISLKIDDQPAVAVEPEFSKALEIQAEEAKSKSIVGIASYYSAKFHGRRTASGERFSSKVLTAAHLTLPFGTLLKVTNLRNMKSVIVRVNDRGPHVRGRIVDLSRAAAEQIGLRHTGTARVALEILAK
jgi:rare lipoprotein A